MGKPNILSFIFMNEFLIRNVEFFVTPNIKENPYKYMHDEQNLFSKSNFVNAGVSGTGFAFNHNLFGFPLSAQFR